MPTGTWKTEEKKNNNKESVIKFGLGHLILQSNSATKQNKMESWKSKKKTNDALWRAQ